MSAINQTKTCPHCGQEIFARATKCKHCGASLSAPIRLNYPKEKPIEEVPVDDPTPTPEVRFCPHCGKKRDTDGKFCPHCGSPFQVTAPTVRKSAYTTQHRTTYGTQHRAHSSTTTYRGPVESHIVKSILTMLFCCQILGLVALIFSIIAITRDSARDCEGARKAAETADKLGTISLILGLIGGVIYVVLIVMAEAAAPGISYYY